MLGILCSILYRRGRFTKAGSDSYTYFIGTRE